MKTQNVPVLLLWFALLFGSGINSNHGVYKNCDGIDKHCIECLQLEMHWGRHYTVPNQTAFKNLLKYTVNEYRSKYAENVGVGNMRYAEWNNKFYEICQEFSSVVGATKFFCVTSAKSPKIPTRFDHDIVDLESTVDFKVYKNSTTIINEQFNILLNQINDVVHITDYNMDEFGCDYSFQPQKDATAFLLRCIFYTNPAYGAEGEIRSAVPCSSCSASETCSYQYPGLCVNNLNKQVN